VERCTLTQFKILPNQQFILSTSEIHYNILLPVKTNFGAILYLKLVDEIHNNMTGDTSGVRTPYHPQVIDKLYYIML
jgi:hypothetical protein